MIARFITEQIPITTPSNLSNKTSQGQVFYNPQGSAENLLNYIGKPDVLAKNTEPFVFLSYSRSPLNRMTQATLRNTSRNRAGANGTLATSRAMAWAEVDLEVQIITNRSSLAENLEEVYLVMFQGDGNASRIPITLSEIFEADHPDLAINAIHNEISEFQVTVEKGNIFNVGFGVKLIYPIFELTPDERTRAKHLVVDFFCEVNNSKTFINSIRRDNV